MFNLSRKKPKYKERTKALTRSHDYRERYFAHNQGIPIPLKNLVQVYFCPYCGKTMIDKKKITVDHLYSVRRVQYTKELREKFKMLPDGVNNVSNLVGCCRRCNSRKGKRGGIWIFLGMYGIYFMPVLRIMLFTFIAFTLVWVVTNLISGNITIFPR